jgi:hypothetical protein
VSTSAERRNRPIERWPMRRFELAKPVTLEVIDGEPPRFLAARRTRAVRREVTPSAPTWGVAGATASASLPDACSSPRSWNWPRGIGCTETSSCFSYQLESSRNAMSRSRHGIPAPRDHHPGRAAPLFRPLRAGGEPLLVLKCTLRFLVDQVGVDPDRRPSARSRRRAQPGRRGRSRCQRPTLRARR